MSLFFCSPELTLKEAKNADLFFNYCKDILNQYVLNISFITSSLKIKQILSGNIDKNDIFVFFNSEMGHYEEVFCKLIYKFYDSKCRIWPIATESNPECRMPPEPITKMQSFDVPSRTENRNPLKNNMKAVAQIFARKIIAQTLSPLYRDEVLYFISHRRIDGEHIASKLADELRLLTRERNIYRDVVNVAVGEEAQTNIDENLFKSDVVIFLQTQQAQNSKWIMKELCSALVHDIPVLWIQIDNAIYDKLSIRPGEKPALCYSSGDFDDPEKLEAIAEDIEDKCFNLIMNSSNQVFSYVECLYDLHNLGRITLTYDSNSVLAYGIKYIEKTLDRYSRGEHNHYIQCFGRNPQDEDMSKFVRRIKDTDNFTKYEKFFLLSYHGKIDSNKSRENFFEENYENYLANIENVSGNQQKQINKRIIISGAFPDDDDEIFKNSLIEALMVYSREIIKRGYTLVFGAHPTFQQLIFEASKIYFNDPKHVIEMHMDNSYIHQYDKEYLENQCTLVLADGLQQMRENMICKNSSELLICLGGKIKDDKSQQGVDIEIKLAQSVGIPVVLVGTVGGRSSEYAYEVLNNGIWTELNNFDSSLNEALFYNINHRLMSKRLLNTLEQMFKK